jgi:predicted aconitase with swiveling domain
VDPERNPATDTQSSLCFNESNQIAQRKGNISDKTSVLNLCKRDDAPSSIVVENSNKVQLTAIIIGKKVALLANGIGRDILENRGSSSNQRRG